MTEETENLTDHSRAFRLQRKIYGLYRGRDETSKRWRYFLIAFDVVMLAYLFVSSFYYQSPTIVFFDLLFGLIILADFLARLWISKHKLRFTFSLYGLADIITIASLLLPLLGENLAFLRVVRMLRLVRSYVVLTHLRRDVAFFQRHEDVITSAIHLLVFIFVMTAVVFESQIGLNPGINNYVDAMYFTVATLTTTGFGDVIMMGTHGKLIAILIMIFGVSLFIKLIQTVFRPSKVRFDCPDCGLALHERDAVHCKHCGRVVDIPNEGLN